MHICWIKIDWTFKFNFLKNTILIGTHINTHAHITSFTHNYLYIFTRYLASTQWMSCNTDNFCWLLEWITECMMSGNYGSMLRCKFSCLIILTSRGTLRDKSHTIFLDLFSHWLILKVIREQNAIRFWDRFQVHSTLTRVYLAPPCSVLRSCESKYLLSDLVDTNYRIS